MLISDDRSRALLIIIIPAKRFDLWVGQNVDKRKKKLMMIKLWVTLSIKNVRLLKVSWKVLVTATK